MSAFDETFSRLRYLRPAAAIVWQAAGRWTLVSLLLLIVQGMLPAAIVYMTKHVVDGIALAMSLGPTREAVASFAAPAVIMGALLLLTQVLNSLGGYVRTAQADLVQDHLKSMIHRQAAGLDVAFFESSKSYDTLNQANTQAASSPLDLINNFGAILQHAITLVAIAGLLVPYGLWLPLFLLVSTAPAFFIVLKHNRAYHRWWMSRTADRRRVQYYDMLLTADTTAPEIRLFDLGDYFSGAYRTVRSRLRSENLLLIRRQSIAQFGAAALALLLTAFALGWVVWRSLHGAYSLGDLALFYQAFNQGQSLLRSLLGSMGQIHRNLMFLENLFAFLRLSPQLLDAPNPKPPPRVLERGIRLNDVTFRYPGSERPALEGFDLFLPAGRTTAIVGENGAGKSTIVKLICRFYDPERGQVTFDDEDIRTYARSELWQRITALFQFPVRYQATAKENIGLGIGDRPVEIERVQRAARQALVHEVIERLPQQYETHLGKWFGFGTELSGGEWQRVSLARAFFRNTPIVMLDEPTSAMDSWAENRWLDRFAEAVAGKTALVITHRFTTAMRADLIYVMAEGKVIEQGSHHSLLALGGHYASSWKTQMRRHFSEDAAAAGWDAEFTSRHA
jgi:ATP-binding cassette, subfamily B, bacterial